jgi:cell division cycle protein 20 (cofactor of APC complex)
MSYCNFNVTMETMAMSKRKSKYTSAFYPNKTNKEVFESDRFITNHSAMDIDFGNYSMLQKHENVPKNNLYQEHLAQNLLGFDLDSKILAFRQKDPTATENLATRSLYCLNPKKKDTFRASIHDRFISSEPFKILDAPELKNNNYLNLLSWGSDNILAVALGQKVYLWNASTNSVDELMTLEGDDYVSSVSWSGSNGNHLAIGSSNSVVSIWDASASKCLRNMTGHSSRVGSLSWNQHILSSGSRDTNIINHDVRIRDHKQSTLRGHQQEVCSLSWSPDGTTLASGGRDNLLCIWEGGLTGVSEQTPKYIKKNHTAAVKALAWCPWKRNLLATGGGTADKTIKFWNSSNGELLNSINTGSKVCSLLWSPHEKEILSSNGNKLKLWSYPKMEKIKEFQGHKARVLHMACSPDGTTCVSASADETLRFWNIFAPPASKKRKKNKSRYSNMSFLQTMSGIR